MVNPVYHAKLIDYDCALYFFLFFQMKPKAFCVVLIMLAILTVCSAHIGGGQLMLQELNPKIYCGRNLARALAELCSYQNSEKRGDSGTMHSKLKKAKKLALKV